MTHITLTLGAIRDAGPCGVGTIDQGFGLLLKNLGQHPTRYDRDLALTLGDVAASNDADDAWWCVRVLDWQNIAVRSAVMGALLPTLRRAAKHTADQRVQGVIADLDAARAAKAAADVARAVAWAAADAAWVATWPVARVTKAAADAAMAAERDRQRADLIVAFPPMHLEATR